MAFLTFFLRADDRPEGTDHRLNNFRPWRFSKTISPSEVEMLVADRIPQAKIESAPWSAIVFSRDVWFFTITWFCATGTSRVEITRNCG